MTQRVNLYQPIAADRAGPPPLTIRAIVIPNVDYTIGGTIGSTERAETYVLLSALPDEIRSRVITAVQALISSM